MICVFDWIFLHSFGMLREKQVPGMCIYIHMYLYIYIYFIVCMQCCSTRSTLIQKNQTWGEILKSNVLKKPSEANPWTGSHQVMIHLFRYVGYVGVELVLGACLFFWGVFAATLNDGHRKKKSNLYELFFWASGWELSTICIAEKVRWMEVCGNLESFYDWKKAKNSDQSHV